MIVPVEIIQQQVQLLSQDCGVYIFRDSTERVLYVGKAKHLKTRLLQYVQGHDGRPMVDRLLKKAVKIWVSTKKVMKFMKCWGQFAIYRLLPFFSEASGY